VTLPLARPDDAVDLGEGAWYLHRAGFVSPFETAALLADLQATLPLRVETLRILGREVPTPRLTAWMGDPGCAYRYSGRTFEPAPFTPALLDLRARLFTLLGADFNTVLANLYRDGRDGMGWHADDEPELGPAAPHDVLIASVSLGATRRFTLRHRRQPTRRVLLLADGDLLVMGGSMQRRWQHAVPKTAVPSGPRLNLTFRIRRRDPGDSPDGVAMQPSA
jgi:alkylated DNA repair dioxygenase AlkB